MPLKAHSTLKSAFPEKAGDGTPTALLGDKSMSQFTLRVYQSTEATCPVCDAEFKSSKGFGPHFRQKHADKHPVLERVRQDFTVPPEQALRALHHGAGMTVEEIADRFDYPRDGLMDAFDDVDVERRGWGIADWYDEEPDRAREHSREVAAKGADAREQNGMAGRTGQDHPSWRGGKHLIDALRKQLRPSWWTVRDEARADECYNCGASRCKLDVHHIVPLSAGGTNEDWNLMTLCESCHRTVESHTRDLPGMEAVLTE